jgi:hypothetical protein
MDKTNVDKTNETTETTEEPQEDTIENTEINNLTLELLVNKSHYTKILHKINPAKFKERKEYFDKINQHKEVLLSMFETLLHHPEEIITRDINESFDCFVKTGIKHLEIKSIRKKGHHSDDEEDEDFSEDETMFGTIEDTSKSLWGEKIKKTKYFV